MKKLFCILFFFFLLFPLVFAAEFSPNILVYSIEPNQELCQQITIFSETLKKFDVYDNLSENSKVEINYTKTTGKFKGEKIIDVCIKGNQLGTYRGAILFKDSAEKNISLSAAIVQLFVDVSEIQQSPSENPSLSDVVSPSSVGSGGGGGGGGSSTKQKTTINQITINKTIQSPQTQTIEISNPINESLYDSSKITGAAINQFPASIKLIIPIVFILLVIILSVYSKRKFLRKKQSSPKKSNNKHLNKKKS